MTREELIYNYGNDICELCYHEFYTSRAYPESLCEGELCYHEFYTSGAYPESLCEGQFCEEAEDYFADEHNIKLED